MSERIEPAKISPQNYVADKSRTYLYATRTEELTNEVLSDGIVTSDEQLAMVQNHNEIIYDYLAADNLLKKMEENPQNYSKASLDAMRFVFDRLHRAREKSYASMVKVFYYNQIPAEEIKKRDERRQKREVIRLNASPYLVFGVMGGARAVQRLALKKEREALMTPEQAATAESHVMDMVNQVVEKGKDEKIVARMLSQDFQKGA